MVIPITDGAKIDLAAVTLVHGLVNILATIVLVEHVNVAKLGPTRVTKPHRFAVRHFVMNIEVVVTWNFQMASIALKNVIFQSVQ